MISFAYEDIVFDIDQMASFQVGRRQWWHIQTLIVPSIRATGTDFTARYHRQLSLLHLHHFVAGQVLDRLR